MLFLTPWLYIANSSKSRISQFDLNFFLFGGDDRDRTDDLSVANFPTPYNCMFYKSF